MRPQVFQSMQSRTVEVHVQNAEAYWRGELVIVGIGLHRMNVCAAIELERVLEPLEAIQAEAAVVVAAFAARAGFKRYVVTSESGKRINAVVVFPGLQRPQMLTQKT